MEIFMLSVHNSHPVAPRRLIKIDQLLLCFYFARVVNRTGNNADTRSGGHWPDWPTLCQTVFRHFLCGRPANSATALRLPRKLCSTEEPCAGHRLLVSSQMYLLTEAQGMEKVATGTGRGVERKHSGPDRLADGVVRHPPPWCPVFSYGVTYDSCLCGA